MEGVANRSDAGTANRIATSRPGKHEESAETRYPCLLNRNGRGQLQAEGLDLQYNHIDLDAPESAIMAAETTRERFGKLNSFINNAGYSKFAPFEQITDREFKEIIETCFYGVVYTTRAALPVMREQKSGIAVQVSLVGGRITNRATRRIRPPSGL